MTKENSIPVIHFKKFLHKLYSLSRKVETDLSVPEEGIKRTAEIDIFCPKITLSLSIKPILTYNAKNSAIKFGFIIKNNEVIINASGNDFNTVYNKLNKKYQTYLQDVIKKSNK